MNKFIYAVFDIKAAFYSLPFYQLNNNVAERHFASAVKDPRTAMYLNPEDFELRLLGEFNDETGAITPLDIHTVCTAAKHWEEAKQPIEPPQFSPAQD